MPLELRTVFVLFELEGLSSPEIAELDERSARHGGVAAAARARALSRARGRSETGRGAVARRAMKDPRRLLDGGANDSERALLRAAASEEPPADGALRLAAALGLPAAAAPPA